MINLTGTWEGEYSINEGTEAAPEIHYFTFRMELYDDNGQLGGKAYDLALSDEPSVISGFVEGNNISFIKKYQRLVFEDNGVCFGDDSKEHPDIHYHGEYNLKDNCYQGTWEMLEEEERVGNQEAYDEHYFSGNWLMCKVEYKYQRPGV
ncbi:hypothetical protein FKX85_06105 [Echinicola soli]|uniref:DUF1579 domain-containing protein n=1 Tax=Echinicola soli TaxID=2591634 RepID=A0A514CFP5_9BACT|nr:hypothetical protein [Echinicola soli]QDH78628.1 hypothetical protein FKX85_06105 [Echinicola soli]